MCFKEKVGGVFEYTDIEACVVKREEIPICFHVGLRAWDTVDFRVSSLLYRHVVRCGRGCGGWTPRVIEGNGS